MREKRRCPKGSTVADADFELCSSLTYQLKCCRSSVLLQMNPTLLVQVQKIESNHEQLAKIGERTDEIKDLHTRHELTVKRNREVQPEVIISSHRACSHLRTTSRRSFYTVVIHACMCKAL